MKTVIYYFSATGNSLKVAMDLAGKIGDTELVSMSKAFNSDVFASADSIGIVFPVYAWGMPLLVSNFIKNFKADVNKYCFSICTCGGAPGATMVQVKKQLANRGIKLSAGYAVIMPTNYIVWSSAIPVESQNKMFEDWSKRVDGIAQSIRNQAVLEVEKNSFIYNLLCTGIAYNLAINNFKKMDTSFFADEKCNSCGICTKVCPVTNIELKEGKPVWLHKCEQCLACIQWCPKESIQFGKKTAERKRYTNPYIKLNDILP